MSPGVIVESARLFYRFERQEYEKGEPSLFWREEIGS